VIVHGPRRLLPGADGSASARYQKLPHSAWSRSRRDTRETVACSVPDILVQVVQERTDGLRLVRPGRRSFGINAVKVEPRVVLSCAEGVVRRAIRFAKCCLTGFGLLIERAMRRSSKPIAARRAPEQPLYVSEGYWCQQAAGAAFCAFWRGPLGNGRIRSGLRGSGRRLWRSDCRLCGQAGPRA
jgi:hypothetical protein